MASIIKVDQLSEKTQGSGITLSHSLKNSSGSEIISSSGSIGSAVDFANIANDSISGDKIHSGTISSSTLDGIKLKSSGDSITKSDGTTAVLSESGGVVTLNNGTISSSVVFPAGHIVQTTAPRRVSGSTGVTGTTLFVSSPDYIRYFDTGVYQDIDKIYNASTSMLLVHCQYMGYISSGAGAHGTLVWKDTSNYYVFAFDWGRAHAGHSNTFVGTVIFDNLGAGNHRIYVSPVRGDDYTGAGTFQRNGRSSVDQPSGVFYSSHVYIQEIMK